MPRIAVAIASGGRQGFLAKRDRDRSCFKLPGQARGRTSARRPLVPARPVPPCHAAVSAPRTTCLLLASIPKGPRRIHPDSGAASVRAGLGELAPVAGLDAAD